MDTAANIATPENRQKVEAAQLDILDAALTLGTGAAYTKEQLEGYRKSYFPQLGDKPETIRDKQDRLNNILEAAKSRQVVLAHKLQHLLHHRQPERLVPSESNLTHKETSSND